MPPRTAKPKNTKGNQKRWNSGLKLAFSKASMSKVLSPEPKYIARAPTRAITEPINKYKVNFIAAYSRVTFHPQLEISKHTGEHDDAGQQHQGRSLPQDFKVKLKPFQAVPRSSRV